MSSVILGLATIVVGGLTICNAVDSLKRERHFLFGLDAMMSIYLIINLVRIVFEA